MAHVRMWTGLAWHPVDFQPDQLVLKHSVFCQEQTVFGVRRPQKRVQREKLTLETSRVLKRTEPTVVID